MDTSLQQKKTWCDGIFLRKEAQFMNNNSNFFKEKPVMKKLRRTLPIILLSFVILEIFAVSGHAKKLATPLEPTVAVTGAIKILPDGTTTDPSNVRVQFIDSSLGSLAGLSFPANADRSPALYTVIMRPGPPDTLERRLRFYYCAHPDHSLTDLRCQDPEGHEDYYYCLNLHYGQTEGKGRGDLNHLTFPVGTKWSIGWKVAPDPSAPIAEGTLSIKTTYDVIK
jgi:hypothetical protein